MNFIRQRLRPVRSLVISFLALSVAACSTGGLTTKSHLLQLEGHANVELPAGVVLSSAAWPTADWFKSFNDSQLDALVERALVGNPSLQLAQARVDQATAVSGLAGASLEPRIDGTGSMMRQRFSDHGTTPPPVAGTWDYVTQVGLGVQYELDFWGKNRAALAGAVGRQHAVEVDQAAARLILITSVVQGYIALQNTDDQVDVEQRQLDRQLDILSLTANRVRVGLDSQVDLKLAQSQIPVRRSSIAALKERRELLCNELAMLTGAPAGSLGALTRPTMKRPQQVALPSVVPAELVGNRPDVVAQRWRVEAAGHDIEVAKASFYPNINLVGSMGLQSRGLDDVTDIGNRVFGIGPAINLPIFEGGRLRAGLALQNANYDAAVETYNSTVLGAFRDVADQLTSLRWLRERMAQQQDAVATADQALDLAKRRYAVGLSSQVQVLIAESAVLQQERALVDLQARALSLDAGLHRALGGGQLPAATPSATSDPSTAVGSTPSSSKAHGH
ncbi:efflux transporter, outer membrane factor (OMF) lipoprotein, NodT family [Pseudoxanthomonas sp. GM95]|uniref:efflux transporter outer membrane subunit n=1 Tax=Pseudoxanthomonas sp. GM95 TaxID=1881043 RepID=UPI0008CD485D|nr:efflux transporter outer membrane subunit [Pseudoxanthomonas sp. GM95]SEM53931.1 efflux transporter, outer membrane factor (OMF) lipoprotein, NodT family [Pseudoxanthomonas sp. GM95]